MNGTITTPPRRVRPDRSYNPPESPLSQALPLGVGPRSDRARIHLLEEAPRWVLALAFFGLVVAILGWSVVLIRGGYVNPEAEGFIPHYLSNQSLSKIIFSPQQTDWGNYQGRELSYVFDWCDCQLIRFGATHGHPHFLSVTHLVLSGLLAFGFVFLARRLLRLQRGIALGAGVLWLVQPAVLLGGSYYRSAKIVAAAFLFAAFALVVSRCKGSGVARRVWLLDVGFFVCVLLAGLSDRQGFAFGGVIILFLSARALLNRRDPLLRFLVTGVAALAAVQAYTYWLGPWLIRKLSGQTADLSFMQLPFASFGPHAGFLVVNAARTLFKNLGVVLGGLPWALSLLLSCGLGFNFASRPGSRPLQRILLIGQWLVPLSAVYAIYVLIGLRQPSVLQYPDFQIFYFSLPLVTLFLALVLWLGADLVEKGRLKPVYLLFALGVASGSLLLRIPEYRRIRDHGVYARQIAAGPDDLKFLEGAKAIGRNSPALRALKTGAQGAPATASIR